MRCRVACACYYVHEDVWLIQKDWLKLLLLTEMHPINFPFPRNTITVLPAWSAVPLRSIFAHHELSLQINASDDRSASSIESKILDVVQMNSVMPDSKPKCLVSLLGRMLKCIPCDMVKCCWPFTGNWWNWWSTWWWKGHSGCDFKNGIACRLFNILHTDSHKRILVVRISVWD